MRSPSGTVESRAALRQMGRRCRLTLVLAASAVAWGQVLSVSAQEAGSSPGGDANATVDTLFADFLHYSVLGRFDLADNYARELLDRSDLDPVHLLRLSERHERSMDTLLILIKNSSIAESAARVMEKIQEGEHLQRKATDRIKANIEKLAGPPQMEHNAIERLVDSGEYAVPWMIQALRDPAQASLRPRVIRALPRLGQPAVNPLVEALGASDENVRQTIVYALGELGYPQAVPYLMALESGADVSGETRSAARTAVERIAGTSGRPGDAVPADGFVRLAERFYDEHGSVNADVRLAEANVWYWDDTNQFLDVIAVPRKIFGQVMAMRCCELALELDPHHSDAIALWLAANIRREGRLGLDVESDDASEQGEVDPTRTADFPRAMYFTSAAGPRFAHLALARAVEDADPVVALGALAGLWRVAGASSLIGEEDFKQPLVDALRMPDRVVRTRAALVLGDALPRSGFRGSEQVVAVLADALVQTGVRNYLVIEPDRENLNRVMGELRGPDTSVVGEPTVYEGIERAKGLPSLAAVFLSSAVVAPEPLGAVAAIREQYEIADVPIVFLVRSEHSGIIDRIAESDPAVGAVDTTAGADQLTEQLAAVEAGVGRTPLTPDRALGMALQSARTLRRIASDGDTVFDPSASEESLVAALNSANEELQIAAIDVLSLLPSAMAQQAVAVVAFDGDQVESLRLPAFVGLAESAKRFGNHLTSPQLDTLLKTAMDDANLRIRTAAGVSLGALNVSADKANQTILKYHRG